MFHGNVQYGTDFLLSIEGGCMKKLFKLFFQLCTGLLSSRLWLATSLPSRFFSEYRLQWSHCHLVPHKMLTFGVPRNLESRVSRQCALLRWGLSTQHGLLQFQPFQRGAHHCQSVNCTPSSTAGCLLDRKLERPAPSENESIVRCRSKK